MVAGSFGVLRNVIGLYNQVLKFNIFNIYVVCFQGLLETITVLQKEMGREQETFNIQTYCNNEIELRDRVLSSKRVLLRNFFTFYIK